MYPGGVGAERQSPDSLSQKEAGHAERCKHGAELREGDGGREFRYVDVGVVVRRALAEGTWDTPQPMKPNKPPPRIPVVEKKSITSAWKAYHVAINDTSGTR